ncbi:MAG TPA: hypothetical protein VNZ45_00635 [Bacteroidia bacterium]|jgi:hypothetical protein|nr:hypothetical protein [Bacteroidia bacterium]
MEKFKTRTSIFHIDTNGIVHKDVIEGVNVLAADVDEDQKMLLKLSNGKKSLVLVNAMVFHTMTPEAIARLEKLITKSRYATAMVSESLGVRIFVDTVAASLKDKAPFKMFDTIPGAVKWLLTVKKHTERPVKPKPALFKKMRTEVCEVYMDSKGILHKKILSGAHVNLTDIKKSESIGRKLAGSNKVLALVDRRAKYTITPAAIKCLQQNVNAKYRIATALVNPKSHALKSVNTNNPHVKVFTDKASAVKWLLSFRHKKSSTQARAKF